MKIIENIRDRAKQNVKRVVLPEAEDGRMLQAAAICRDERLVVPVLVGNKQNIENNRRADRLAKDANESKDLHTSLFNEKYSDPAMVSKIKDLAQAKIDAGDFIKLDKGGFQIKLNLNENVGWENQTPTKVIEVRISEKGVWHFFPTRG